MADEIQIEGRIIQILPGTMFRVELDNKHPVLAHISGRMRKHFVRLTTGDRVIMEMSPHDLQKGRILRRIDPPRPANAPPPTQFRRRH